MLEIMRQEDDYRHGNDCMQKNCFVIIKCHDKYITLNIRRYIGWCDNGIELKGIKEFDNLYNALDYYNGDLRKL